MALKDLITDLSNFKYTDYGNAGSSQSQIEGRHGTIDAPIDNSDFDNGVGLGVDPNSTPQSFNVRGYTITGNKRFIVNYGGGIMENQGSIFNDFQAFDGIAGLGGGAPYYGNLLSITPRQSIYRDNSGNYQTPQEGGNTLPPGGVSGIQGFNEVQTTLNIDGSTFSNTPLIPNAQGSNFMVTPLGDTSYSNPSDSLTLDVGGISFNNEPLIPNAQGSNFMVTPLGDTSFSNPSDSLTLDVGGVTFNNSPFIPNAQGSNFLVTPIGNTSFSNPSDSITFDLAGGINTTPFIPNAQGSDFMVTPIGDTNLPNDTLTHNVGMINLTGPTTQTYQTSINVEPSSPNAHGSDFFTTPLENYTSQFSIDNLNTNINSGFDRNSMYISGIDEPNTPVFNQFTRGDSSLNVIGLNSPNFNPFEFQNGLPYVIPQHNSTGPTQFTISDFDNTPKVGNAHGSDFFTTPLENYTSQFSSDNYQTDINSGFDRTLMYISDIDEPNTPVFNQFTRGDGSLSVISFGVLGDSSPNFDPFTFGTGLPYVIPQHSSTGPTEFTISGFDDTKLIDNLHGSDFMTRPSLESQISTDTSTHDVGLVTTTHPSGIGVANITTLDTTQRFSNAHSSTNSIGGLNIDANSTIYQNMDSILDPGSNYLNLGVNNNGGVGPSRDFNASNFYITDQSRPSVWQDDQFLNFTKSDKSIKTIDLETKLIDESIGFDILNPLDSLNNAISGQESWDFPTDRLPYTLEFEGTNFPGLTPNHPIIIRDIGQTYGYLGEGIKTNRALVDQERISKVLLTASGVRFLANQQLYHTFNPRLETRLYNPLSMNVSSFPMIRQNRHIGGTYENEGIDFGETSILTKYADAIGADIPIIDLIGVTAQYRTTNAHALGMVPSSGGKPQLGAQPEIILNGDNIQSLDPSQWRTSQITDRTRFYPHETQYGPYNDDGKEVYSESLYATGQGRLSILPFGFGRTEPSNLFQIKNKYDANLDGEGQLAGIGKAIHIPSVFQGNLFPGGTKSKDNWYYPNHNTIGFGPVDKFLTISQGNIGYTTDKGMVATKQTIFFDQDRGGVDKIKTRGLDLSFGDRIINQQFKGNLYNKGKRYESNPERFEKSPDNTQRKFLGFFASIGVNKNIIYKNKFGPDESNITVNGEPILVTTKLDITAPKANETKWKKLNQYKPEPDSDGFLARKYQTFRENQITDGKVNPTSIFYSDDIIKLNEPAVDKITYRSDNPSLETLQPIFPKLGDKEGPFELTDFRLIGNGQGGNQGPEGQALGFLNRESRKDKHEDSRLGPKLKRKGYGPDKQDAFIKSALRPTISGQQKPASPKQVEIENGNLPTDVVFNAIQHNVEGVTESGLGSTKREAKFPAAVVKKDGDLLNRYKTLAYGEIPKSAATDKSDTIRYENLEKNENVAVANINLNNPNTQVTFETRPGVGRIRLVGGNLKTDKTDNVNLIPYGRDNDSDYIPFKFYDMNNDKHIVFRATLSGISDSYSPEWSSQRYIGRPDNVHVYQGVSRELSFDFVVAPFSKQEMLVCWEKLNYLAGLTYPTWKKIGNTSRMDAPFTALTIGNMFSKTPGYINSLSYTIEDNVSWDIDKNNQVPQVVNVSVTFTHIGRHKLASQGKHYDLPWLKSLESGTEPYTYKISNKHENDGLIFSELPGGEVMINQVQDQDTTNAVTSPEGNNTAISNNLDESGAVPDGTGIVTMGDGVTTPMLIQDNY